MKPFSNRDGADSCAAVETDRGGRGKLGVGRAMSSRGAVPGSLHGVDKGTPDRNHAGVISYVIDPESCRTLKCREEAATMAAGRNAFVAATAAIDGAALLLAAMSEPP